MLTITSPRDARAIVAIAEAAVVTSGRSETSDGCNGLAVSVADVRAALQLAKLMRPTKMMSTRTYICSPPLRSVAEQDQSHEGRPGSLWFFADHLSNDLRMQRGRYVWRKPVGCVALLLAVLLLSNAVRSSAQNARPEVPASLCGLSFMMTGSAGNPVRSDWIVSPSQPQSDACRGEVKSRLYDKLVRTDDPIHFWMISVDVLPKKFEALMEDYDVHRSGDRWFVGEGARESPAYEIKGPGWWGLRVDHFGFRGRSRAATGSFETEAVWVLISETGGNRTAHLMAGSGADDELLSLMLNSLRFDRKQ